MTIFFELPLSWIMIFIQNLQIFLSLWNKNVRATPNPELYSVADFILVYIIRDVRV